MAEQIRSLSDVSDVTVITSERSLGESELTFTRELSDVTRRIRSSDIKVIPDTVVEDVIANCAKTSYGERFGPYDAIVLSTGTRSRHFPEDAMAIGDCLAPRGIWAATHDAAVLVRQL